jgi:hypothetical protein
MESVRDILTTAPRKKAARMAIISSAQACSSYRAGNIPTKPEETAELTRRQHWHIVRRQQQFFDLKHTRKCRNEWIHV